MARYQFPYKKYMDKAVEKVDWQQVSNQVFINTDDGVWVADKNGVRIDFYAGMVVYTAIGDRIHADDKWIRNRDRLAEGIADAEKHGRFAEAENVTATELVHDSDWNLVPDGKQYKAVMLTAYNDDGLPIKACVNAKLLKGFPKDAMFYVTSSTSPVMVCLPETKGADGYAGRTLPIAIVMPFMFWHYDITHRD